MLCSTWDLARAYEVLMIWVGCSPHPSPLGSEAAVHDTTLSASALLPSLAVIAWVAASLCIWSVQLFMPGMQGCDRLHGACTTIHNKQRCQSVLCLLVSAARGHLRFR